MDVGHRGRENRRQLRKTRGGKKVRKKRGRGKGKENKRRNKGEASEETWRKTNILDKLLQQRKEKIKVALEEAQLFLSLMISLPTRTFR